MKQDWKLFFSGWGAYPQGAKWPTERSSLLPLGCVCRDKAECPPIQYILQPTYSQLLVVEVLLFLSPFLKWLFVYQYLIVSTKLKAFAARIILLIPMGWASVKYCQYLKFLWRTKLVEIYSYAELATFFCSMTSHQSNNCLCFFSPYSLGENYNKEILKKVSFAGFGKEPVRGG